MRTRRPAAVDAPIRASAVSIVKPPRVRTTPTRNAPGFHSVLRAFARIAGAVSASVVSAGVVSAGMVAQPLSAQSSPFAAAVVDYATGTGAATGFTNPAAALGAPERFTGEGLIPGCVTPFQPAFRPDEVVSIGVGGSLTVRFAQDVTDDPRNPFGIDLLVFGNAFFTDGGAGSGVVAGLAAEGGRILVSADGLAWSEVRGVDADGLFPTLGYLDVGPYAVTPGRVPSDFLRPVDPTKSFSALAGLDYAGLLEAYDGSGGGAGIDLAWVGLDAIRYVRIDGPTSRGLSPEIDAFADVAPLAPSADIDGDGTVGPADLAALLAAWGAVDALLDLDGNGTVGSGDLAVVLSAWSGA